MNKWMGLGRLTADPDFRENEINPDSSYCKFTVATDRPYSKDKEQTADFIRCVCFGKSAKFVDTYFHKGDPIIVEGRIQTGKYVNKDGITVYTTDIMVEKTDFCPKTKNDGEKSSDGNSYGARDASEKRRDDFRDIPDGVDEELPFK